MSTSMMHHWKLPRTILIFALITAIIRSSLVKGKRNTYWSKRSGKPGVSNQMPKETKRISKPLKELPIHTFSTILRKINRYFYSGQVSKLVEVLPLKQKENVRL